MAEQYLNKAIQAFGVQSQGDLLTGCIVPFDLNNAVAANSNQQLASALSLIALVKSLMQPLADQIQIKACVLFAPILLLEDDHELISGVVLLDGYSEIIRRSFQNIEFGEAISLFIKQSQLNQLIESRPCQITEDGPEMGSMPESYFLGELAPELTQSINRKRQYISR